MIERRVRVIINVKSKVVSVMCEAGTWSHYSWRCIILDVTLCQSYVSVITTAGLGIKKPSP